MAGFSAQAKDRTWDFSAVPNRRVERQVLSEADIHSLSDRQPRAAERGPVAVSPVSVDHTENVAIGIHQAGEQPAALSMLPLPIRAIWRMCLICSSGS